MWKKAIFVLLCATHAIEASAKLVRQVQTDQEKIVVINTSLGYSTLVEFTSKPLSAVLGDQDSFKLEYVGNSITVKPLLPYAKSNLFVFTAYDRFNCALRTVPPAEVDYLVRVSASSKSYPVQSETLPTVPVHLSETVKTKTIQRKGSWQGYSLKAVSMSLVKGSEKSREVTLFEFQLGTERDPYTFSVGSLGMRQLGHFIPIESIYLDSTDLKPQQAPLRGKIVLLNQDFRTDLPLSLLFAVPNHRIQIVIPAVITTKTKKGK
jgi:hypothetical protein